MYNNRKDSIVANSIVKLTKSMLNRLEGREPNDQTLEELICSKSIVLDNIKEQLAAGKSNTRIRRNIKRRRGLGLSQREVKRSHIADLSTAPAVGDAEKLHALWQDYMNSFLAGCKSESQLQSRLGSIELVGARVVILESAQRRVKVGCEGIVTGVSQGCLYIAEAVAVVTKSKVKVEINNNQIKQSNIERNRAANIDANSSSLLEYKMHSIIISKCILGVYLPNTISTFSNFEVGFKTTLSPSMCVLHGKELTWSLPKKV